MPFSGTFPHSPTPCERSGEGHAHRLCYDWLVGVGTQLGRRRGWGGEGWWVVVSSVVLLAQMFLFCPPRCQSVTQTRAPRAGDNPTLCPVECVEFGVGCLGKKLAWRKKQLTMKSHPRCLNSFLSILLCVRTEGVERLDFSWQLFQFFHSHTRILSWYLCAYAN